MRRALTVAGIVSLLLGLTVAGCGREPEEHANAAPTIKGDAVMFAAQRIPASLATAPVSIRHGGSLTMNGRLVWDEDQTVRVFSPYSGRVERILGKLGDAVQKGQPLAEVDSSDYDDAQADYRKAFATQTLAHNALARARDLHEHGVVAMKDLEQAQADAISADAETQRTSHLLTLFGTTGDNLNAHMTLRSPINGIIVERSINPGQELRSDQSAAPQFVITDPAALWVLLDAHEGDLAALRPGAKFQFRIGSNADDVFEAQVLRVADYVDPVSRTIKVLGRALNRERRLKGEMFVTATVPTAGEPQPQAPAAAVYLFDDHHYAFVRDGSSFVRREVRIGSEQDGQLAILAGAAPGELVVTQGALFLQQLLQSAAHG